MEAILLKTTSTPITLRFFNEYSKYFSSKYATSLI